MISKAKDKTRDCDAIAVHLLNKLWDDKPCPKLSTVRRNLFGFYEKNKNSGQVLDEHITNMAKKSSQEWNFDFANELPQSGRYVWQRVRSYDVPFWYAAVSRPTFKDLRRKSESDHKSSSVENTCQLSDSDHFRITGLEETERKMMEPNSKKPRLVQTSMKDFTRIQKRRSSCRLRLKQLKLYSNRLRNQHHHLPVHCRSVTT